MQVGADGVRRVLPGRYTFHFGVADMPRDQGFATHSALDWVGVIHR